MQLQLVYPQTKLLIVESIWKTSNVSAELLKFKNISKITENDPQINEPILVLVVEFTKSISKLNSFTRRFCICIVISSAINEVSFQCL